MGRACGFAGRPSMHRALQARGLGAAVLLAAARATVHRMNPDAYNGDEFIVAGTQSAASGGGWRCYKVVVGTHVQQGQTINNDADKNNEYCEQHWRFERSLGDYDHTVHSLVQYYTGGADDGCALVDGTRMDRESQLIMTEDSRESKLSAHVAEPNGKCKYEVALTGPITVFPTSTSTTRTSTSTITTTTTTTITTTTTHTATTTTTTTTDTTTDRRQRRRGQRSW
uniref:Uncharacterized protein n=1 Tax=Zooxanthella nutricula TaxID=1333877 RepID=A0A7S2VPI3_9DINO